MFIRGPGSGSPLMNINNHCVIQFISKTYWKTIFRPHVYQGSPPQSTKTTTVWVHGTTVWVNPPQNQYWNTIFRAPPWENENYPHLFWWAKIKTRTLSKNVKIDTQEYVYRGPPPNTIYKNSKNIERTMFWCVKIKTRSLLKNVKKDPQEYVYQGSPPLLSTKTPKT